MKDYTLPKEKQGEKRERKSKEISTHYSINLIFSLSAFFRACPVVSFALLLG